VAETFVLARLPLTKIQISSLLFPVLEVPLVENWQMLRSGCRMMATLRKMSALPDC